MVDLHTHSNASDGTLSPRELVAHAAQHGLSALALTDHDTVDGLAEAVQAGHEYGVRVIPGIEIEVDHPRGTFHLLGIGMWRLDAEVEAALRELKRMRTERNLRMVAAAQNEGMPLQYHELVTLASGAAIGRPHFARLMVRKRLVVNEQDAFERYLGDGRRLHVHRERLALTDAITMIHQAGGKAVLAHPLTLLLSWTQLSRQLRRWKDAGLDGVEAYHANSPLASARRIAELARELDLIVTAGSDFHGPHRTDRQIGRGCEGAPIDEAFALPFLPTTAV